MPNSNAARVAYAAHAEDFRTENRSNCAFNMRADIRAYIGEIADISVQLSVPNICGYPRLPTDIRVQNPCWWSDVESDVQFERSPNSRAERFEWYTGGKSTFLYLLRLINDQPYHCTDGETFPNLGLHTNQCLRVASWHLCKRSKVSLAKAILVGMIISPNKNCF